jgi:hypothetical protein
MTTQQLQAQMATLLAELAAIRFAHLIVKPVLTMPAKEK